MNAEETVERAKAVVQYDLGVEPDLIVPGARFREDLGADSLDHVELVMEVEKEFDIDIEDEDAEKFLTFGAVTEYLTKRLACDGDRET